MSRPTSNARTSSATASNRTARRTTNSASSGEPGPVERTVRSDIAALVTLHPMGEALAEMAITLARSLDEGAGLATAAVNRELRANLLELARMAVDDDDDLDAALSTPIRDDEDT